LVGLRSIAGVAVGHQAVTFAVEVHFAGAGDLLWHGLTVTYQEGGATGSQVIPPVFGLYSTTSVLPSGVARPDLCPNELK
jgi:hypothetical protein